MIISLVSSTSCIQFRKSFLSRRPWRPPELPPQSCLVLSLTSGAAQEPACAGSSVPFLCGCLVVRQPVVTFSPCHPSCWFLTCEAGLRPGCLAPLVPLPPWPQQPPHTWHTLVASVPSSGLSHKVQNQLVKSHKKNL